MILDVYWASIGNVVDGERNLATVCKELDEDDFVIFIVTTDQEGLFKSWVSKNTLLENILLETSFITNGSHSDYGRRLKLIILSKQRSKND